MPCAAPSTGMGLDPHARRLRAATRSRGCGSSSTRWRAWSFRTVPPAARTDMLAQRLRTAPRNARGAGRLHAAGDLRRPGADYDARAPDQGERSPRMFQLITTSWRAACGTTRRSSFPAPPTRRMPAIQLLQPGRRALHL